MSGNKNTVALITGATSGIGKAIAEVFAKSGYRLAINGFGEAAQIAEVLAHFKSLGASEAIHIESDMSKAADIEKLIKETHEKLGSLDVLINNAGIQHTDNVENFPVEKWDQIIAINLTAAFHTIRLAVPLMKARNFGRIINIASVHGLVASNQKAAYVASKHGLIGLTKVVALELAETGITCNAVCPGWVLTPLVEKQVSAIAEREKIDHAAAVHKLVSEKQPSNQFVELSELGELCLFLAGPAARSITGVSLPIDGGWTAR
ncbi:MAG: 3-hydroxybutyrate dehydrogenase [Cyanobacteria bacterium SZAS TMP-1]|nr:3-hydroxybutyrate dehydrogenase [Cyanobacteria bacterium SZAS TMP-1]